MKTMPMQAWRIRHFSVGNEEGEAENVVYLDRAIAVARAVSLRRDDQLHVVEPVMITPTGRFLEATLPDGSPVGYMHSEVDREVADISQRRAAAMAKLTPEERSLFGY